MLLNHLLSSWLPARACSRKGRLVRRTAPRFRPSCERLEDRCVPAELSIPVAHYYSLNGTYADQMGGPSLTPDGGALQGDRYVFAANKGLKLSGALANPNNYSIVMRFELDAVNAPAFKKIIDFANRTSDNGLYVAGPNLRLYSGGAGTSVVTPNVDFVMTLTRNGSTGETKVYFNNVLQQTYTGAVGAIAVPPNNLLTFFEDDNNGGEAIGGSVDYVATFDGVLTPADVAIVAGSALGVTANQNNVGVAEGQTAVTSGTWSDNGIESVSLTASIGTIVKNPAGTWSWSYSATDGPDSRTVTITATDSDGVSVSTQFTLTIDNVAPFVAADAGTVAANEGGTAAMNGTWSDPGIDGVTLSASAGAVIQNANGTWSWSGAVGNGPASQTVTITATDSDGASRSTNFVVDVSNLAPSVGSEGSATADEGQPATVRGTWSDPGGDEVTLSASVGSVVKNADFTWSWTGTFSASQFVTITATDGDGASSETHFSLTVNNLAPTTGANDLAVTVAEGGVAALGGTWSDPGADDVSLTASVGTITRNGDGTWSWSFATSDGPDDSQTVIITATDSDGASSSATFALIVANLAPTVAANAGSVTVAAGGTATMGGTWADPGADVVTLTASVGSVVRNADGTWSWSHVAATSQTVTITATDSDGASSSTSFTLTVTGTGTPQITQLVSSHSTLEHPSADGLVTLQGAFANAGKSAKVEVNWGDGSKTEKVRVDQLAHAFQGRHRYANGGVFTITVTLTDENGAKFSRTTTAVVSGASVVNGTLQVIGSRPAENVTIERVVKGIGRFREEFYRVEIRTGQGRCFQTEVFYFRADKIQSIMVVAATNDHVHLGRGVSAKVVTVAAEQGPDHGLPRSLGGLFRYLAGLLEALRHGGHC